MKKTKFIKTFLCILLTLGTTLFVCNKSDVVYANTHTLHTVTGFGFVDHHAYVNVDFTGYEDTVRLRINIRIEKQFMFFNRTLHSQSYEMTGESYQNEFFYPIYQDGAYNCTVTYTITDSEGVEDVIIFRDTQNYISDEHTEHTHVWNHERIEPTYAKDGVERTFCYCGISEETVLKKPDYSYDDTGNDYQSSSSSGVGASGSYVQYTGTPKPNQTNQSASLNQPFNGFSGYQSYCNCMSCMWERSTAKINAANPKKPSSPTVKTTDPWYSQYMEPKSPTNCHRFNR
jgi:hypothetical protein